MWIVFIYLCIILVGGLFLPIGLVVGFGFLFWFCVELPVYLGGLIRDEFVLLSTYLFAMALSAFRTYRFDGFRVAHEY